MADESIIVKQQGTIFLGGPPLVSKITVISGRLPARHITHIGQFLH